MLLVLADRCLLYCLLYQHHFSIRFFPSLYAGRVGRRFDATGLAIVVEPHTRRCLLLCFFRRVKIVPLLLLLLILLLLLHDAVRIFSCYIRCGRHTQKLIHDLVTGIYRFIELLIWFVLTRIFGETNVQYALRFPNLDSNSLVATARCKCTPQIACRVLFVVV